MRAAIYTTYGPPEVVSLGEIPKPAPKEKEVLVRVHATTVNRTDCGFRSAQYFISRLFSGLFRPKIRVLGCEFAGVVEDVGADVRHFRIGSHVFGYDDDAFGCHAEYKVIAEDRAIAFLPDGQASRTLRRLPRGVIMPYALFGRQRSVPATMYWSTVPQGLSARQPYSY